MCITCSRVMADTIATSSEMGRSSRSMAKWEAQQAVWARQQSSISRKMRRPVPELAMSTVRGRACVIHVTWLWVLA